MITIYQGETGGYCSFSYSVVATSGYVDVISARGVMYRADGALASGYLTIDKSLLSSLSAGGYRVLPQVIDAENEIYFLDEDTLTIERVPDFYSSLIVASGNSILNRLTALEDAPGGGVTDHGELTGLGDDDHTQYLNVARGDARYYTETEVDTALSNHATDTTNVHGITDTSALVLTNDSRLSDSRTPTSHASTHASAGSDPITISESQVTNLTSDLAGKVSTGDSRLSDARTPTAHASSHASAGSDPLTISESQVTNLTTDLAAKQPLDATLTALAGVTTAADKLIYATGSDAFSTADLTSTARSLLDDGSVSAMRTTLGAATAVAEGRPKLSSTPSLIIPGVDVSTASTTALTANSIRYEPFLVTTAITLDQIACEVTTNSAASTTIRLAIYNADTDWQPTSLVVDAGTVAADSNGFKSASINTTLQPGRYLKAINSDSTPTVRSVRGSSRLGGFASSLGSNTFNVSMLVTSTYGSYASTGVAWTSNGTGTSPFTHTVFLRVSTP